jgi:hypothetical protein
MASRKVTLARVMAAVEADSGLGFCKSCGATASCNPTFKHERWFRYIAGTNGANGGEIRRAA